MCKIKFLYRKLIYSTLIKGVVDCDFTFLTLVCNVAVLGPYDFHDAVNANGIQS